MHLIIQHSSMVPIYEQIYTQIEQQIIHQTVIAGAQLPSVRGMAKELSVSALTVKKAYDQLEASGLIVTVHGKGSFVATIDPQTKKQEQEKEIEAELGALIQKAQRYDLSLDDFTAIVKLLWEEN
ncbi:GntR family transcriptional regulator [Loigolactobacillus binensis]|uniref:GntR family transcriptional regulator n=1 Tax=Loigolactobacillus binensis TaxID=2559922 RepID=A0ABW3ECZ0_9LACO|nr:GntR family transcriptional regulator [Loigolactobacillus binensis]